MKKILFLFALAAAIGADAAKRPTRPASWGGGSNEAVSVSRTRAPFKRDKSTQRTSRIIEADDEGIDENAEPVMKEPRRVRPSRLSR